MNNLAARIDEALGLQKSDFILWAPVFLGIGAGLYFGSLTEPGWAQIVPAIIFSAAALFSLLRMQYKGRLHSLAATLVVLGLLLTCLGFGLGKLKTEIIHTPILKKQIGPVWVEGTIAYTEKLENERDTLFLLEDIKIECIEPHETPKVIRLTSRIRGEFLLGNRIKVLAKISPPSKPVMPYAYDFRRHYYFQEIGGIGFILKKPEVISNGESQSYPLEKARQYVSETIRGRLDNRLSGIASALVTGERAAIEEADWEALRASGLAHIISISGLHVALFATSIFFFTRLTMAAIPRLALFYPIKKICSRDRVFCGARLCAVRGAVRSCLSRHADDGVWFNCDHV